MKLATYRDGSRDGQLVVVSRDLTLAHYASGIASRLQQVLDDWNFISPQLEALSQTLDHGKARHAFAFDPKQCMAPLPRAFQMVRADLSGADIGSTDRDLPLSQAASDALLGPHDDVARPTGTGIDFGAEIAVITGDLDPGSTDDAAIDAIRLLMLGNIVTRPEPTTTDGRAGPQRVGGRNITACSPVAATPDELGTAWRHGRVHLDLVSALNGEQFGRVDAGTGTAFHFGRLIAHLGRDRAIRAGSIVGSGPVSSASLQAGDTVRIEMLDASGMSVFGAIEQKVIE